MSLSSKFEDSTMPRRPSALADQFLDPPDLSILIKEYAAAHTLEQMVAFIDGANAIFGIVDEMLYAKMKDGSRWHETQERAFYQISEFNRSKFDVLEQSKLKYQKLLSIKNESSSNPDTSLQM